MKENGQHYWDTKAESWVAGSWERFGDFTGDIEKYIQEKLDAYISDNDHGLILNLGSGGDDYCLDKYGNRVIQLDYSRNMLLANKSGLLLEADARNNLPIEDESVENICSFFLMRYLSKEQQAHLIAESLRVLKKNGYLVIIDMPNNNHPYQVEKFTPEELRPSFESPSMDLIECRIEKRSMSKYISTGFGGWYEKYSYSMGVIVAKKI